MTIPITRAALGVAFEPPRSQPIPVRAILAVGRNYREHAEEMRAAKDAASVRQAGGASGGGPLIFTKAPGSAILHGEPIVIPPVAREPANQTDYEGELAVVIGRPTKDTPESEVADPDSGVVLGYTAANDVSARWWQKQGSGGQFHRGKSFDTFCPIGPSLVPAAVVAEHGGPQGLVLTTTLNGERVQHASTADMIFPVHALIAELSRGTTLLPGTVILTGTPAGVGVARTPQRFLTEGDTVTVTIAVQDDTPLGILSNPVTLG